MVSPYEPAVEVPPQPKIEDPGTQSPAAESPDPESPEMIRARELIEKINALEAATRRPRSISGKRKRLLNSRRLLRSRTASIPDFARHSRKCQVCRSSWVEEIEEAYFNWSSAQWIINAFNISYDDAVYRHARALGLNVRRRKNVAIALEKLIEKVDEVTVTSSTVIRAVRALSCLDANGRWSDLPSTHIVLSAKDLPRETSVTATANPSAEARSTSSIACPETARQRGRSRRERSEPMPCQGTALAVPKAVANSGVSTPEVRLDVESVSSTDRSEPSSQTDAPESESAAGGSYSFERSEPHRASDRTIPANGPFSKIKPRASSIERPEPNRGTYEKLEIAANCRKQSAEVNSNRGNFRD